MNLGKILEILSANCQLDTISLGNHQIPSKNINFLSNTTIHSYAIIFIDNKNLLHYIAQLSIIILSYSFVKRVSNIYMHLLLTKKTHTKNVCGTLFLPLRLIYKQDRIA